MSAVTARTRLIERVSMAPIRSGCRCGATQRRVAVAATSARSVARFGGSGRGGTAERPADVSVVERAGWDSDRDTGGLATLPRPDAGDGAASGSNGGAGGNYRLLLLDAPAHTEQRVVTGICRVVQGVDEAHAKNVFATSKELGLALVVSCLKEHAEFYRQQLYLYGLKTAIEPDNTTA